VVCPALAVTFAPGGEGGEGDVTGRRSGSRPLRLGALLPRPRLSAIASGLLVLLSLSLATPLAEPATGDIGIPGPSSAGAGSAPTGEKPESKLWWNDGRWWASMYQVSAGTYHIWWLNQSVTPETWVDTGVQIDNRPKSRADTLWDGTHLYVGSAVFASSNTSIVSSVRARLYRFSYDRSTRTYSLDAGFPVTINNTSVEAITIDKDTSGRLWATWAQNQQVFYNETTTPGVDTVWGTPAVLPLPEASHLDPDDISALAAFGKPTSQGGSGGHIGVMWSNQVASTTSSRSTTTATR
jgi:hypothetical protein